MEKEYNVGTWLTPSDEYIKDIKQTLVEKGVATELTPNEELSGVVKNYSFLKELLDYKKSCTELFYNSSVTDEELNKIIKYNDTENVTDFSYMFYGCTNITRSPLLNEKKVTNWNNTFNGCKNMISASIDTEKAINVRYLFQSCQKLQTVELSSLDGLYSASNATYIFANCYSIKKIIIRNMTKVPVIDANSFTNCYHLLGTVNSNYNPNGLKDGFIYIPDEWVDKVKVGTDWSLIGTQIKGLSELEE